MDSPESLKESIEQYSNQLEQIKQAINATQDEESKNNLISLQSDIRELLKLTQESLEALEPTNRVSDPEPSVDEDDPFAKEYALFKAEISSIDPTGNQGQEQGEENTEDGESEDGEAEEDVDIEEELKELVGSKCQAPYTDKLGVVSFHNALVSRVEVDNATNSLDGIKVFVLFTNPTEEDMVPCTYYLDGKCKFSDSKCRSSHGYPVPFQQLKEYQEPDFKLIKPGCAVLAKVTDKLWKSTVIEDVVSNDACTVKYQRTSKVIPIHDVFPLQGIVVEISSDESDSEYDKVRSFEDSRQEEMVDLSLTNQPPAGRLGEWEKFTKGIGSKLMAKMGYIVGTGLGKKGEGRLEPVQAQILPAGKSLDHCMNLKEAAGGAKDLFSAEKIQKKLALRELRKSRRAYHKKKEIEKHNVFTIINDNLGSGPSKKQPGREEIVSMKRKIEQSTGRELNVERFKIAEGIKQAERSIYILEDTLTRVQAGSIREKNLKQQLGQARRELQGLHSADSTIAREQTMRDTKKKLTIF